MRLRRLRVLFGLTVFVWPCVTTTGEVVISEFQANNCSTLADEDGDSSDWLELYNAGASVVQLDDWHLSNDVADPLQWAFPALELGVGEYLVVFASGKGRRNAEDPLHTNFRLSRSGESLALLSPELTVTSSFSFTTQRVDASYGRRMEVVEERLLTPLSATRYLIPTADVAPGASWREPGFDDSDWDEAVAAIGFDVRTSPGFLDLIRTDVGESMRGVSSSLYLRLPFETGAAHSSRQLLLRVAYDDGFVAFINGTEVASRNLLRTADGLGPESRALVARRDDRGRVFEEIRLFGANQLLQLGQNVLAIHALNARVSDNDFFVTLELVSVGATLVAKGTSGYFEHPTPGWPNGPALDGITAAPTIQTRGGLHVEQVEVVVTTDDAATAIRYTTDGTNPTSESSLYSTALVFSEPTELRARAFSPGRIGSAVVESSYTIVSEELTGFSSDLPIVVVSSGVRDAWSDGHLYILDRTSTSRASFVQPATLEERAAFKIRGSSSTRRPKRSFNLELRDDKGNDVDRELLGLPADSDFILYGAYNFDRALIRNPLVYEISRQIGRYAARSRFCELFLSTPSSQVTPTSYLGVYSLMEKVKRGPHRVPVERLRPGHDAEPEITGGYIFKRDRLDPGDEGLSVGGELFAWVDPKEVEVTTAQGSWLSDYIGLLQSALAGDEFADPAVGYARYLDVGSFIDHHLLNELAKNPDEFVLSTFLFKPRGGKLHAGPIWDFDRAMGSNDDGRARDPEGWLAPDRAWYGRLFDDPGFLAQYTSRWEQLRTGALDTRNLRAIIDRMADELREAQERNFARWTLYLGEGGWQGGQIDRLKTWLAERVAWIDSALLTSPPVFAPPRGAVAREERVSITAPEGTVYYTLDRSDPRATGGGLAQSAILYGDGVEINEDVIVVARARLGADLWTERVTTRFTVLSDALRVPGDFDQDGRLSLDDVIGWISFVLGDVDSPCESAMATLALLDLNADRRGNLTDVVGLLTFLFRQGPAPATGVKCILLEGCPSGCF